MEITVETSAVETVAVGATTGASTWKVDVVDVVVDVDEEEEDVAAEETAVVEMGAAAAAVVVETSSQTNHHVKFQRSN